MSVRVIAGRAKGRRLRVPDVPSLRPTGDRARETLFNILAPRIAGARFLDVFAGCGAVGIEALSRGAAHVAFVEELRLAAAAIEENLATCRLAAEATVVRAAWEAGLRRLAAAGAAPFDLAFFDPPYDWAEADRCLETLAALELLAAAGAAIIEHRNRTAPPTPEGWHLERRVAVGDTAFSLYALLY